MTKRKNDKKRKNEPRSAGQDSRGQNRARGLETRAQDSALDATAAVDRNRSASERTDADEFGALAGQKLNKLGSKHGFMTSTERDHRTGGEGYEYTGSENREGMGSGTQAGPAHSGHSKPPREHGHGSEPITE